jgi:hypothetical protein
MDSLPIVPTATAAEAVRKSSRREIPVGLFWIVFIFSSPVVGSRLWAWLLGD